MREVRRSAAKLICALVQAPADHKLLLAARAHERLRGRRRVHGLLRLEARRLDRSPLAVLEGVEAIDGVARLVQAAPQQDAAVLQRGAGRAGDLRAFAGGLPRPVRTRCVASTARQGQGRRVGQGTRAADAALCAQGEISSDPHHEGVFLAVCRLGAQERTLALAWFELSTAIRATAFG